MCTQISVFVPTAANLDALESWSLSQMKNAKERKDAQRTASATAALTEWVTFFKGAPTHAHLRSIGVFYREDGLWLSAKDLENCRRETSTLTSLEPLVLARLDRGVLHEFSTAR